MYHDNYRGKLFTGVDFNQHLYNWLQISGIQIINEPQKSVRSHILPMTLFYSKDMIITSKTPLTLLTIRRTFRSYKKSCNKAFGLENNKSIRGRWHILTGLMQLKLLVFTLAMSQSYDKRIFKS